jgi:hypothetical protein
MENSADNLVLDHPLINDPNFRIMYSLLQQYKYELPLNVAHYFMRCFANNVLCGFRINKRFFLNLTKYRRETVVIFEPVMVNGKVDSKVVLGKVVIKRIHENRYHDFLEENPHFNGFHFGLLVDDVDEDTELASGMTYRRQESSYLKVTITMPKIKPLY